MSMDGWVGLGAAVVLLVLGWPAYRWLEHTVGPKWDKRRDARQQKRLAKRLRRDHRFEVDMQRAAEQPSWAVVVMARHIVIALGSLVLFGVIGVIVALSISGYSDAEWESNAPGSLTGSQWRVLVTAAGFLVFAVCGAQAVRKARGFSQAALGIQSKLFPPKRIVIPLNKGGTFNLENSTSPAATDAPAPRPQPSPEQ